MIDIIYLGKTVIEPCDRCSYTQTIESEERDGGREEKIDLKSITGKCDLILHLYKFFALILREISLNKLKSIPELIDPVR